MLEISTGSTIRPLDKFLSTAAFNSSDFLKFGEADFHIFPIIGLQMPPEGGAALFSLIPMGAGVEVILIPLGTRVVPSTTVLLIRCRVLFVPVFFEATSAMISCNPGELSNHGACTIPVMMDKAGLLFVPILRSNIGGKT